MGFHSIDAGPIVSLDLKACTKAGKIPDLFEPGLRRTREKQVMPISVIMKGVY
jgi:hypothetical protein